MAVKRLSIELICTKLLHYTKDINNVEVKTKKKSLVQKEIKILTAV